MTEVIEFLEKNGYVEDKDNEDPEYRAFHKEGVSAIDINGREIVFIGETGDWLRIPCNRWALLGALIHYRQLSVDYKW